MSKKQKDLRQLSVRLKNELMDYVEREVARTGATRNAVINRLVAKGYDFEMYSIEHGVDIYEYMLGGGDVSEAEAE